MSTRTAPSSSPGPGPGSPAWPRPVRPRLPGRLAYRLQPVLAPNSACRWRPGVLAPGYEHGIPGTLERAGLARRDPAVPAPTFGGQRAH